MTFEVDVLGRSLKLCRLNGNGRESFRPKIRRVSDGGVDGFKKTVAVWELPSCGLYLLESNTGGSFHFVVLRRNDYYWTEKIDGSVAESIECRLAAGVPFEQSHSEAMGYRL